MNWVAVDSMYGHLLVVRKHRVRHHRPVMHHVAVGQDQPTLSVGGCSEYVQIRVNTDGC